MNDFETRFDPPPPPPSILENTSKISIHPSACSKMHFRKKVGAKKSTIPRKKERVIRVNEFSFASKRWPRVESRRHRFGLLAQRVHHFEAQRREKMLTKRRKKWDTSCEERRRSEWRVWIYRSIGLEIFRGEKTFDDETNAIFISKVENKLKFCIFYVRYSCIILESLIY